MRSESPSIGGLLRTALMLGAAAAPCIAQNTVQVPLNYNFNGIVHAGEEGQPDAPNGFRSISDRALDFRGGVPAIAPLLPYRLVTQANTLDIVHLGNRNTVNNGFWAFDPTPDSDNVGIRPAWLANTNQTGPQVTQLASAIQLGPTSRAGVLYQFCNGGGSFDVTFVFASGQRRTATLQGVDWFGGSFPGMDSTDRANPGANLNVSEGIVDLSANAGETVQRIEFSNLRSGSGSCAILAMNIDAALDPRRVTRVPLAYNFNGIVHQGEDRRPDDVNGFRSISDRALDFRGGVPSDARLDAYDLVGTPGVLDLVHLGDRNRTDGGNWVFDIAPDGDDVGVQPAWLAQPDQSGPQTTPLAEPILLDGASDATFLFQISNGGGSFDVTFEFGAQGSVTTTLSGADWFGGPYPGTDSTDRANPGAGLFVEEQRIDLSPLAGFVLTAITFSNPSNPNAGFAILAANVSGCRACPNRGAVTHLGGGTGPTLGTTATAAVGCSLDLLVDQATPSTPAGLLTIGFAVQSLPISSLLPGCPGVYHVASPIAVPLAIDGAGHGELFLDLPPDRALCGSLLVAQFLEASPPPCALRLSDALSITVGH
ncbi:MAG: hypothetical protein O3C51_08655 [Planctomycetota bacterium]|nr:hypothetical protein [Planctomycetota bacterium]